MLLIADMIIESQEGKKHKDLRPTEVTKSEKNVQRALSAITSFLNSFNINEKDNLYCLSSGAAQPKTIKNDLINAEESGKNNNVIFSKERLEKM